MPRISFDYPALDTWYEATGEGASKWDICTKCFRIDSRQLIGKLRGPYNGEPSPEPSEPLSHYDIGEENPSLHEGEDCHCDCCDKKLMLGRNY